MARRRVDRKEDHQERSEGRGESADIKTDHLQTPTIPPGRHSCRQKEQSLIILPRQFWDLDQNDPKALGLLFFICRTGAWVVTCSYLTSSFSPSLFSFYKMRRHWPGFALMIRPQRQIYFYGPQLSTCSNSKEHHIQIPQFHSDAFSHLYKCNKYNDLQVTSIKIGTYPHTYV